MKRCPECNRYFPVHTVNEKGEEMLEESFRVNPNLKIICTTCGMEVERRDWIVRMMKRRLTRMVTR
jgi:hypothetical protein